MELNQAYLVPGLTNLTAFQGDQIPLQECQGRFQGDQIPGQVNQGEFQECQSSLKLSLVSLISAEAYLVLKQDI